MKNKKSITNKKSQQGIALLTVLTIVAIMTIIGAGFFMQQTMALKKTAGQLNYMQAYQYALGGEEMVKQVLHEDWTTEDKKDKHFDSQQDKWTESVAVPLIEGGEDSGIQVEVRDLHRKFNINNLFENGNAYNGPVSSTPDPNNPTPISGSITEQIIRKIMDDYDFEKKQLDALFDWVDHNDMPIESDTEDESYLALDPPYRAGNMPLQHLSELRLIHGFGESEIEKLSTFLEVVPAYVKLNVNFVDAKVLSYLYTDLNESDLEAFLAEERAKKGFETFKDYTDAFDKVFPDARMLQSGAAQGGGDNPTDASGYLDVKSEYFEVRIKAVYDESICYLVSVLYRDPEDGKVTLVSRNHTERFKFDSEKNAPQQQQQKSELTKKLSGSPTSF